MSAAYMKINTFMERFDVSERTTYRLIANGELDVLKIGRATRLSVRSVSDWENRNVFRKTKAHDSAVTAISDDSLSKRLTT